PFEVTAEDARSVGAGRHLAQRREQLLLGRGDQRRQVRSDAGLEQRLAGAPVAAGVRVQEVHTAEAVHLQVDEAGCGDAVSVWRREAVADYAPLFDLDVAGYE